MQSLKNSLMKIEVERHKLSKTHKKPPILAVFYIILHIKQANTQEKKLAIKDIIMGSVSFFVFAPAK